MELAGIQMSIPGDYLSSNATGYCLCGQIGVVTGMGRLYV